MKKLLFVAILAFVPLVAGDVGAKKITGAGSTVQLSTTSTSVRWVQLQADAANTDPVYYGDCTVAAGGANGFALPKGSGQLLPGNAQGGYDLAQVCVYVSNNDVVWVSWEKF